MDNTNSVLAVLDDRIAWLERANPALEAEIVKAKQARATVEAMAEALQWYVENDDTNIGQEGNERYEAGLRRAESILATFHSRGPATGGGRKVGCEGDDGLLRVHAESETCDVCATSDGGNDDLRHGIQFIKDHAELLLSHTAGPTERHVVERTIAAL